MHKGCSWHVETTRQESDSPGRHSGARVGGSKTEGTRVRTLRDSVDTYTEICMRRVVSRVLEKSWFQSTKNQSVRLNLPR